MDREAVNVNDRREGAETAPSDAQRAVADLEAADRKLAAYLSARASGAAEGTARIEEARSLLRTVIRALTRASPAEAGEDTGTGKRRVKIKAESEVASPNEGAHAGAQARAGVPSAKATARGARTGRRSAAAEKTAEKIPAGSLLARLGAAAVEPAASPSAQVEAAPAAIEAAQPVRAKTSISDAVERLAQLEAEIADLTEAVAAPPPVPEAQPATSDTIPSGRSSPVPDAASGAWPDEPGDDDDDAEITIIGPDGAPTEPVASTARHVPRIFREGPPPFAEEEAAVEIRGPAAPPTSGRSTERPGTVRVSARTSTGIGKGSARGKWRLFRDSS